MNEKKKQCVHKWVFMESNKFSEYRGNRNYNYTKIDRFYCEKCLKTKEVKHEETSYERPDWY